MKIYCHHCLAFTWEYHIFAYISNGLYMLLHIQGKVQRIKWVWAACGNFFLEAEHHTKMATWIYDCTVEFLSHVLYGQHGGLWLQASAKHSSVVAYSAGVALSDDVHWLSTTVMECASAEHACHFSTKPRWVREFKKSRKSREGQRKSWDFSCQRKFAFSIFSAIISVTVLPAFSFCNH